MRRVPQVHPVRLDRPGDVLDLLRPKVIEREAQLIEHLIADDPADADSPRLGQRLQSCGDVDTVAKNVVVIDDDVTDVDADTKLDPLIGRQTGIALGHATLHVDRAAHRIDYTGEFQQQAIAGSLDDPAAVFGDLRVNKLPPVGLQTRQRGAVVAAHEKGIAHHIGRYDRRQSSVVPRQASLP